MRPRGNTSTVPAGLLGYPWRFPLGPGMPGEPAASRRRGHSGVRLAGVRDGGDLQGGTPVEEATRCDFDGATLRSPLLVGRCQLSTFRGATVDTPRCGPEGRLVACDLSAARVQGGNLERLQATGCAARGLQAHGLPVGRWELTDLLGARFEQVAVSGMVACDASAATFVRCDFAGADLSASRFRRATFEGCSFAGARVVGADFTGARGLDAAGRAALLAGGAVLRDLAWLRALARVLPGASPARLHTLVDVVRGGLVAVALLLSAAMVRAAWTPPAPPASAGPPAALVREPTPTELERTRANLKLLRESIAKAQAERVARGATERLWPTISEVQENAYDRDGDGPDGLLEVLVPGGFPDNYLTTSIGGVLPYCNEVPDQVTLAGVDTDWHYCEETGRVFASAGFTDLPTLAW